MALELGNRACAWRADFFRTPSANRELLACMPTTRPGCAMVVGDCALVCATQSICMSDLFSVFPLYRKSRIALIFCNLLCLGLQHESPFSASQLCHPKPTSRKHAHDGKTEKNRWLTSRWQINEVPRLLGRRLGPLRKGSSLCRVSSQTQGIVGTIAKFKTCYSSSHTTGRTFLWCVVTLATCRICERSAAK